MFSWRICLPVCFVSFQSKGNLQHCGNVFFSILITSKGVSGFRYTLIHFKTLIGNLIRWFSPAQTITTESTAKKWVDKRVQIKKAPKDKLSSRRNTWSKVQEDTRYSGSKSRLAATATTPLAASIKKDSIFNLRISREFRFIQSVYTVRNIANRTFKTASKFEKEILKFGRRIVHVLSNMQNIVLWPFLNKCKEVIREL